MTPPPLVTIGMPVYNGARYLERALDAALAQTHPNLEIIVSDNCSTDRTEEICRAYAGRDPRIRNIRQSRNIGLIANFEFLVREAQGDYFCWHAADDGMDPAYAATLAGFLDRNPDWAVVGSDVRMIDEDGRPVRIETVPALRAERLERDWPAVRRECYRYYAGNRLLLVYGLFRTAVLKEVSLTAFGRLGEVAGIEIPLLAQVSARGKTVSIPEVLKTYRLHGASAYGALDRSGLLWRLRNYGNIWRCLWTVAGRAPGGMARKMEARAYLLASFPVYVARLSSWALLRAALGAEEKMTFKQLVGSAVHGLLAGIGLDVRRNRPVRDSTRQLALKMAERGVRGLIDVGANMGQFGRAARKAGYDGVIFSIEPLAEAHAICARIAARDSNWHLLAPMALGATAGTAEINVAKNLASSSFLEVDARSLAAAPESVFMGKERVDVRTLDAIADPAWPRPLALKIDTQGYEREVLAGAAATLADVALILVEMSLTPLYGGAPGFAALYAMIEGMGFRCIGMTQGFCDHDRGELLQVDALFIRDRADAAP